MLRFHYEWVSKRDVRPLNRLLAQGWRPVREIPIAGSEESAAEAVVLLEREDPLPVLRGDHVADGVPLDVLQDVDLLHGLTGEEVREIAGICTPERYDAEAVLFDEGQGERKLTIVLEGQVSIQLLGLMIDDPIVLDAGPGDVFGETTFFAPSQHTTRAVATTAVKTLALSGDSFDELLQVGRPVAAKLATNAAALLGQRLQSTDSWVRELLQGEESSETLRSFRNFRRGLLGGGGLGGGGFVRP